MTIELVTAPQAEPITLAEAKQQLRLTHDLEDALVLTLITAARQHVEVWCERALMLQTWRLHHDAFTPIVHLLGGRVSEVANVKYRDLSGIEQTLDSAAYYADMVSQPARLMPVTSWPATATRPNAVSVTYTLGYATAAEVPFPIKAAMLLLLSDLFENREATIVGTIVADNPAVERLLMPYRRITL